MPIPVRIAKWRTFACSIAQQIVDTGLGACLGVNLFDDDSAIQIALATGVGQRTGYNHRPRGYSAVEDFVSVFFDSELFDSEFFVSELFVSELSEDCPFRA